MENNAERARPEAQRTETPLAYRINTWCRLTETSRSTVMRQHKRGALKIIYVGDTLYVPASEAARLGLINAA